ncbi:hypothetical protein STEG23_020713, partial [Scotinomys teguina]
MAAAAAAATAAAPSGGGGGEEERLSSAKAWTWHFLLDSVDVGYSASTRLEHNRSSQKQIFDKMSSEEGIVSPGTRVLNGCELP